MATEARAAPLLTPRRYVPGVMPVIGGLLVAALFLWLGVNLVKTPSDFLDNFLIGLTNGAIYGLVALGYSLVYGILELINFAHGDVFMLGGVLTVTIAGHWVLGLTDSKTGLYVIPAVLLMLVCAMGFCGILNATVELIAYRRLRGAPRLAPLITAIGMSFILQNVGLIWTTKLVGSPIPVSPPDILPHGNIFTIGSANYSWNMLIVVLVTTPVLVLLLWLVQGTRQGKAMRATAQDMDAAAMMGINVNRTISFTFLIAGALAGAAGVMFALYTTNVKFDTGFRLGLFAFTAAVLGGIGNLPGAVLRGVVDC